MLSLTFWKSFYYLFLHRKNVKDTKFVSMYAYLHLTRFKHHVTNMTDVTGWAGSANPSGVPLFTSGFSKVRVAQYLVFCVVFCRSLLFVLFFFLFFNLLTIRLHVPLILEITNKVMLSLTFWKSFYCLFLHRKNVEDTNSIRSCKSKGHAI
jgi:hypothetical protein